MDRIIKTEDKFEIVRMRAEGNTLQCIADKYNVSRQRIEQILTQILKGNRRKSTDSVKFKALRSWMVQNGYTLADVSSMMPQIPYNSVVRIMHGKQQPSPKFIVNILEITGMPFETIFGKNGCDVLLKVG